jgi:putative DNA primase/helicase
VDKVVRFDFNDAPEQEVLKKPRVDANELKARLLEQLHGVLLYLFPAGKHQGKQFVVGDLQGNPGKSLVVEAEGVRAGIWFDFATREGGDIFEAWARVMNMDAQRDFPQLMMSITRWLGDDIDGVSYTSTRHLKETATQDIKKCRWTN